MTREEAIKHLEDMKKGLFLWDMTELIDLCISALSENKGECKECKWYDNERIYKPECENCSRNFNDNFCRSDMRAESEDK